MIKAKESCPIGLTNPLVEESKIGRERASGGSKAYARVSACSFLAWLPPGHAPSIPVGIPFLFAL
jgi:hypothetical protein